MVTRGGVSIPVSAPGADRTRRQLREVGQSVGGVAKAGRGLLLPLLGGGLLAGAFGGGLLNIALSGGGASNAMIRLQDSIETLLAPLADLFVKFVDLFEQLPAVAQLLIALGGALFFVRGAVVALGAGLLKLFLNPVGLVVLAVVALIIALYVAFTRSEGFRKVIAGIADVMLSVLIPAVNLVIQGINNLILGFRAAKALATGDFGGFARILGGQDTAHTLGTLDTNAIRGRVAQGFANIEGSDFVTQEGQGFTGLEQRLGGLLGIGNGGAQGTTVNQYYGISPEELNRQASGLIVDPNREARAAGGP